MWDYLYSKDAGKAFYLLGEKGINGKVYCIGGGEARPLKDYIEDIRNAVNPEAEIGLGDIPFNGVDISYSQFDLKKVEKDTGYKNQVPFAEGILMTADYIRGEAE